MNGDDTTTKARGELAPRESGDSDDQRRLRVGARHLAPAAAGEAVAVERLPECAPHRLRRRHRRTHRLGMADQRRHMRGAETPGGVVQHLFQPPRPGKAILHDPGTYRVHLDRIEGARRRLRDAVSRMEGFSGDRRTQSQSRDRGSTRIL